MEILPRIQKNYEVWYLSKFWNFENIPQNYSLSFGEGAHTQGQAPWTFFPWYATLWSDTLQKYQGVRPCPNNLHASNNNTKKSIANDCITKIIVLWVNRIDFDTNPSLFDSLQLPLHCTFTSLYWVPAMYCYSIQLRIDQQSRGQSDFRRESAESTASPLHVLSNHCCVVIRRRCHTSYMHWGHRLHTLQHICVW